MRLDPINIYDYEARAKLTLPHDNWDFIEAGAMDELTTKRNRSAFDELQLRPRFMRSVEEHLRTGCWNLMIVFKPEILILGGGIMKSYFKFISESIYKRIPETLGFIDHYQLMNAEIQVDSALVGGAELIFRG